MGDDLDEVGWKMVESMAGNSVDNFWNWRAWAFIVFMIGVGMLIGWAAGFPQG